MYQLRLMPSLQKDLDSIFTYLLEKSNSLEIAKKEVGMIESQVEVLRFFPEMGFLPPYKELITDKYKCLILGNYLVYYRFFRRKKIVEVYFAKHVRQDISSY
jgi:plasmid stabilization system protein ParE